jgi:hypothetical protein
VVRSLRHPCLLLPLLASVSSCDIEFVTPEPGDARATALISFTSRENQGVAAQAVVRLSSWGSSGTRSGAVVLNGTPLTLDSIHREGTAFHSGSIHLSPPLEGAVPFRLDLAEPGSYERGTVSVFLPALVRGDAEEAYVAAGPDLELLPLLLGLTGSELVSWELRTSGGAQGQGLRITGHGRPPEPLRLPVEWLRPVFSGTSGAIELTAGYSLEVETSVVLLSVTGVTGTRWVVSDGQSWTSPPDLAH